MFNLGNLITSCLLSMGVASNTTPICNTPKKAFYDTNADAVINDYTIDLNVQNESNATYTNNYSIGNTVFAQPDQANDTEYVTNFRATNTYVNILATKYETIRHRSYIDITGGTAQQRDKYLTINQNNVYNNLSTYYQTTSTVFYIFQIDSYNYNLNNNFSIKCAFSSLSNYGWESTEIIEVTNLYFIKEVYITYQDNWSNYIQKQLAPFNAYDIKNDIEDINNGFYYTKVTSQVNYTSITQNNNQDVTNIDLMPNNKTYVAIKYTPMTQTRYRAGTWEDWDYMDAEYETTPINYQQYSGTYIQRPVPTNTLNLSGTNLVPDSHYEVIDIPGLMWEILTMPFAFVSQAFNLTLFPGTPYQLNISNLFLSILAILAFVWIISFIIKLKG